MKAFYRAEAIGWGINADVADSFRFIPQSARQGVADTLGVELAGGKPKDPVNPKPWVAEIVGKHPKYRYERRFLKAKVDYSEASSTGNRGIWFCWTLETGRVYETSARTSWGSGVQRSFVAVTDDGDVTDLTEEEVEAWLAGNDFSASTS